LIELHAAACNPSDIAFIRGGYNIIKPLPAIPGFEASGKVISVGKNAQNLLGKNISCFVQSDTSGTWAENFVVNINDLIVLDKRMDLDQGAAFSVNPFTAFGMIDIAKNRGSKAILQNAAGGQVAEFIRRLAEENGMKVINIARKPETVDSLVKSGEKFVLFEQDENFAEKLKSLSHELNATTAFDAVGGELAGIMFNAMPKNAELVSYGGLSGKNISGISEMDLIFKNKTISGFNLIDWKKDLPENEFQKVSENLQEKFILGKLKTKFQSETTLDEIVSGLKTYIKNMSAGKLLIKP
jgi:NADPH:quinone reductase-like Zn-dependent oxidoreductase